MIRAVIFDFNGVLVDDESVHFELFREVLAEEGVAITEHDYHERYLGLRRPRLLRGGAGDAGQSGRRRAARRPDRAEGAALRRGGRAGPAVLPGRGRDLTALAARWPVAINSGALRPEIEFALDRLGRRDRVAAIVSAEDAPQVQARPRRATCWPSTPSAASSAEAGPGRPRGPGSAW